LSQPVTNQSAGSAAARPTPDQPRWVTRDDEEAPARPALTRRRIVLTALSLVEEEGLEKLTMRRVASALKVTPMSLYNHVADKKELVDLMVDFLIGDVVAKSAEDEGDWEAKLRAQAWRNYRTWRDHPGIVGVYVEGVNMGPNGLANSERAIGLLRDAGFSDEEAAGAFLLLYRWSMATVLVAPTRPVSRHQTAPKGSKSKAERINAYFSALPLSDIPNIEATATYLVGTSIDFGLDVIFAGLKARLAAKANLVPAPADDAADDAGQVAQESGPSQHST
jgi:AcrR family transcriptional regulator